MKEIWRRKKLWRNWKSSLSLSLSLSGTHYLKSQKEERTCSFSRLHKRLENTWVAVAVPTVSTSVVRLGFSFLYLYFQWQSFESEIRLAKEKSSLARVFFSVRPLTHQFETTAPSPNERKESQSLSRNWCGYTEEGEKMKKIIAIRMATW